MTTAEKYFSGSSTYRTSVVSYPFEFTVYAVAYLKIFRVLLQLEVRFATRSGDGFDLSDANQTGRRLTYWRKEVAYQNVVPS